MIDEARDAVSPKPVKHPPIVTVDEAEALLSRLLEIIPALMAIIEQETTLVRAGRLIEARRSCLSFTSPRRRA